jgi:hypothetical protein
VRRSVTIVGTSGHLRRNAHLESVKVGQGAHASAAWYSIVETAKANGLKPYAYIRYVLEHIASAKTVEDIEALLPWNVSL